MSGPMLNLWGAAMVPPLLRTRALGRPPPLRFQTEPLLNRNPSATTFHLRVPTYVRFSLRSCYEPALRSSRSRLPSAELLGSSVLDLGVRPGGGAEKRPPLYSGAGCGHHSPEQLRPHVSRSTPAGRLVYV